MILSSTVLSGVNVFIGGPIQHAIQPGGFLAELRSAISTAIREVERRGASVSSAHVVERFGLDTSDFTPDEVTVRDFAWMRGCDVFVPVLPVSADGVLLRTDGTHIELGWATALGRPIVGITPQPFVDSASHLLKGLRQVADVRIIDAHEFVADPSCLVRGIRAALGRQSAPGMSAVGDRGRG